MSDELTEAEKAEWDEYSECEECGEVTLTRKEARKHYREAHEKKENEW